MLKSLFGNDTTEKCLLYLLKFDQGYGKAMAEFWDVPLSMIQKQLSRLEQGGVIASQLVGKTRLYTWNPRYPFKNEVQALMKKAFDYLPASEADRFKVRTRPRRQGKPL